MSAIEDLDDGDIAVVSRNQVAISPLRLSLSGSVPASLARALTRSR
jgi:hypothetical protein